MSVFGVVVKSLLSSEAKSFASEKIMSLVRSAKQSRGGSSTVNKESIKELHQEVGEISANSLSAFIEKIRSIANEEGSNRKAVDEKFRALEDDILQRFVKNFSDTVDVVKADDKTYDWQVVYHVKEYGWLSASEKLGNDRVDAVRKQWVDIMDIMHDRQPSSLEAPPISYPKESDDVMMSKAYESIMGDNYEIYRMKRDAIKMSREKISRLVNIAADTLIIVAEQAAMEWARNRINYSRANSWKDIVFKLIK